jgi:hypothetical protein
MHLKVVRIEQIQAPSSGSGPYARKLESLMVVMVFQFNRTKDLAVIPDQNYYTDLVN